MTLEFKSQLREDLLPDELAESGDNPIQVFIEGQYVAIVREAQSFRKTVSPGNAKNITQVMELIQSAIEDRESREDKNQDAKVIVTRSHPDKEVDKLVVDRKAQAVIAITIDSREPGSFSQGPPGSGRVRNRRAMFREELEDPDNPGYKRAILGYLFDNVLDLTVWARTNKTVDEVSLWLEDLMMEYEWWFVYSGANRVIYHGRGKERTLEVNQNKWYGREVKFFVRTEKLTELSQKKMESIIIRLQHLS